MPEFEHARDANQTGGRPKSTKQKRAFKILAGSPGRKHPESMKQIFSLIAIPFLAVSLSAAEQQLPGDREVTDYFRAETMNLSGRCLADVHSLGDWQSHRDEYRRQFAGMLGLWPMPERTDLKPVITGKLNGDGFTVDKLFFEASPHLYVTANLYLPKIWRNRHPQFSSSAGTCNAVTNGVSLGNKTASQQHGSWFAQNGYVCLVVDSLQLGEIQGIHTGTPFWGCGGGIRALHAGGS